MRRLALAFVFLAACTKNQPAGSGPTTDGTANGPTCAERLGLTNAKPLVALKWPAACRPTVSPGARDVVGTEPEAKVALGCPGGVDLGVDFTTQAVLVTAQQLSPLGVGTDALDDGAKVTFVRRERSACPNEGGPPMPIVVFPTFVIPKGGPRNFAEVSCHVETPCR